MKNLFTLIVLVTQLTWGQMPPSVQQDLMNFEPGELIVKLKDNVDAGVTYLGNGKAMSSFNIGELLGIEDKIESSSVMFHQKSIEASIVNKEKMKAVYMSKGMTNPKDPLTMKNIFVLKTLNEQENIQMLIEEIKNNPNVEYAEPNYIYSIDDFEVGEIIYDETDGETEDQEGSSETSSVTIEVDDPLYSSQTNITSTNIDDVWDQYTTGDGSQVIAILDTGGDYTHPDLEANTWINTEELNGVEGYDDDGNGYIDDFRGWDFINIDNAPLDDNMHGTHVAGIAGAVGNNGIGIAGAAWNVKLMHVKVFQANGQGDSAIIAEGVEYAYMNGATIINMSFGSYAESSTLRLTLENAYTTAILVAAAGNDGKNIGPCLSCKPLFPAAYNFVFGVEDRPRPPVGYTNYDQDGPINTGYTLSLLNYELAAPGTGIMSTIPGGGYSTLTGTSMSTPLITGGIALILQQNSEELISDNFKEIILGDLINTSGDTYVDFLAAIQANPTPLLKVINATIDDDISSNTYIDSEPDTGEIIHLFPLIKNYWGSAESVMLEIQLGGNEFQNEYWEPFITFEQSTTQAGSIGPYATYQMVSNPFILSITENVPHNTVVNLKISVWEESIPDVKTILNFSLKIKNAIKLQGVIENDIILTADKEYLIDNTLAVIGATIYVKPGVIINIGNNEITGTTGNIQFFLTDQATNPTYPMGKMIALGTKDSLITFKKDSYYSGLYLPKLKFGEADTGYGWTYNGSGFPYVTHMSEIESISDIDGVFETNPPTPLVWEKGYVNQSFEASICSYCDIQDIEVLALTIMNSKYNYYASYGSNNNSFYKSNLTNYGSTVLLTTQGFDNSFSRFSWLSNLYNFKGPSGWFNNTFYDDYISNAGFTTNTLNAGNYNNNYFNLEWAIVNSIGNAVARPIGFRPTNGGVVEFENAWIGAGTVEKVKELNIDITSGSTGVFLYSNPRLLPYEETHGMVWKVEVNGINSFDNYNVMATSPIGIGTHEFKVYFNRAMDTSVDPQISYGSIYPYTQKIISEEGSWSADAKIYTVNHDIGISIVDGINRIRVQDAQDLDYFKIPLDLTRFNFYAQAAGSLSSGWYATAGLGNIALTWEAPTEDEVVGVLGYNMYRYQVDADGVESTPVKLNETLIVEDTDESTTGVYYTDFNVVEGETYFYKYNILRTSFEVTDYSSVVSTTPLTSTLGDSNGDFAVDVLDLVHDVDYILGNNPTPFIFLAGDVNADLAINVLDIVATVDIILNPSDLTDSSIGSTDIQFYPSASIGNATFSWEGNDLFVESDHNIGGLQLAFSNDFEYSVSSELATIEKLDYIQDDNKIVMLFSFNNTVISSGKTKLLTRLDETKDLNIDLAVVGTTSGSKLTAVFEDTNLDDIESPFQSNELEFLSMIPNPTSGMVNLKYYLPEQMDGVVAKVYDMLGRLVHIQAMESSEGMSNTSMQLNKLQTGNYIVLISGNKNGGLKTLAHKMLIVK